LKDGSCQAPRVCAILYSECNYGGASYNLCDQSPNFQKDQVPPVIKSVKVPPNGKVTLFEQNDYGGRSVVYTESQPCIDTFQVLIKYSSFSGKVVTKRLPCCRSLKEVPRLNSQDLRKESLLKMKSSYQSTTQSNSFNEMINT
jgi:hypothetical protein